MARAKPHLVIIEWEDTTTHAGWRLTKDVHKQKPASCKTVGWLVGKNKRCIQMAASWDEQEGEWNDRSTIPRGCIKSIRVISEEAVDGKSKGR